MYHRSLKQKNKNALFIFVNLICMFLFISFKGLLNKDCRSVFGDLFWGRGDKNLQMVHCTAMFIFVKWNKVQFR